MSLFEEILASSPKMMKISLITVDFGSADQSRILGTGSELGLLLRSLIKLPVRNAILFLDEIDRVVNGSATNLLTSLLPFFEPNTKHVYNACLNAEIDISHYFIIGAGNRAPSDSALKDRISIIKIDSVPKKLKRQILREKLPSLLWSEEDRYNLQRNLTQTERNY